MCTASLSVRQLNAALVARCRLASFGDSLLRGMASGRNGVESGPYMEPRASSHHCFYLANGFIAMPPNPALNRTGRYEASTWPASALPAG